jgi:hypothetical protein
MEQGRCPVCGYDGSTVSPADAAVALRSFPRRFRETLEAVEEADGGPAGQMQSGLARAAGVAHALEIIDADLARVLVSDQPPVNPPPLSASDGSSAASPNAEAVLAHLTAAATGLAGRVSGVTADDWKRTGRQPDGSDLSALDLLRHAVHIGVHALRESRVAPEDDSEE